MRDNGNSDETFVIPDRGYETSVTTQTSTTRLSVHTAIAGQDTIGACINAEVPSFPLLASDGALAVDGAGPLGAQTMISWNAKTGGQTAAAVYLHRLAQSLGYLKPSPELTLLAENLIEGKRDLSAAIRVKSRGTEDRNLVFAAGVQPQTVNLVIKVRDLLEIN